MTTREWNQQEALSQPDGIVLTSPADELSDRDLEVVASGKEPGLNWQSNYSPGWGWGPIFGTGKPDGQWGWSRWVW